MISNLNQNFFKEIQKNANSLITIVIDKMKYIKNIIFDKIHEARTLIVNFILDKYDKVKTFIKENIISRLLTDRH